MGSSALEETLNRSARASALREIQGRVAEHGVRHVYLQYTSVPGRTMGKAIPARHFERVAEVGLPWTRVAAGGFASSYKGELIGPTGPVASEGLLVPDLDTFELLPWDTETARVFCDHFHRLDDGQRPGAIALGDCRGNLKLLREQFREEFGLELKSGCEPEMSWFPSADAVGTVDSRLPAHVSTAYHIDHFEQMRPIVKRITQYAQAMGLDMIQADYEDAGQIELNFAFGPCLTTSDRLITYRQICMQVAREFDVVATFMPKPVSGVMANGCHHHLSLWRHGEPVFSDAHRSGLGDLGRWALGGLLAHARGMSAVVAQTVNSYVRFWEAGLFAPTAPTWGFDNRLCLVRVLGDQMEYRAPDACCNPYLTHAVLLAAIADGIRRRIEPGLPEPTDAGRVPEALRDVRFPSLPRTLGEAIEAFEADEVVSASLPTELRETFLAIKRDEWERSCGAVTDWQRAMYLGYLP